MREERESECERGESERERVSVREQRVREERVRERESESLLGIVCNHHVIDDGLLTTLKRFHAHRIVIEFQCI